MTKRVYSKISSRYCMNHIAIWEEFMEVEVPFDDQGRRCIIHHLDGNHENNEITNLACVTISEHVRWHASRRSKETLEKKRKSMIGKGKGRKMSEEAKQKLRKPKTKEHIEKNRISHLGQKQ